MERILAGVVRRWSGVASTASTTVALGGMVHRSLGDGCVLMDEHRAVALFGDVAAWTASWARIMWISTMDMGQLLDCRDGFGSVCI